MKTILALLLLAATTASAQTISGEIRLEPAADGRLAVLISTEPGSVAPQSFAFKLVLSRDGVASLEKTGDIAACKPAFSWSNDNSYVVVLDRNSCPLVGGQTYEVARLSVDLLGPWPLGIDFDPKTTILSDQGGLITATAAKGNLRLTGYTIMPEATRRRSAGH
jgi:hypothetical protein